MLSQRKNDYYEFLTQTKCLFTYIQIEFIHETKISDEKVYVLIICSSHVRVCNVPRGPSNGLHKS